MPIYAYKCESCGHRQDILQKMSEPTLSVCPACGAPSFAKQLTAAGFQLKGSGWYATDFRGGKAEAPDKADDKASDKAADKAGAAVPAAASATPAAAAPPAGKASPPASESA
ncbi:MAG: FmdB family zinc ribbon protein [Rubrivivax sp.]